MMGGLAAGWFGFATPGFVAFIAGTLAIEMCDALGLLSRSIFASNTRISRLSLLLHVTWDIALVGLGVLTIEGSRVHRLFAPLMTAGLLHVPPPPPETGWRALAGDRGVLATLLALAAGLGLTEGGFMLLALLLVALRIATPARERG
jgi:hypothetical protein